MRLLRAEELDFVARAPKRFVFSATVTAPPAAVFDALSADPMTWAAWFPRMDGGSYEGEPPYGVGTRRQVAVGRTTYRETIMAWDAPHRWTYRVDETNAPIARALIEEWTITGDGGGNGNGALGATGGSSRVTWTFAIDPTPLFRVTLPLAPFVMGRLFRKAMANLSSELAAPATFPG
jgi:hypothetical protein